MSYEVKGQDVGIDLSGKSALVTGAGRGIGAATAEMLAAQGAKVVLVARTEEEIMRVARRIEDAGGQATAAAVDVSNVSEVQQLFDQIEAVDVLVNSAGIIEPIQRVEAVDPGDWELDIDINLFGVFLTCHFALPWMLDRNWGRIINVSSGAAKGGTVGWSAYAAAKAGVEAFTKTLAAEVAATGIRANAMRPGVVDTEMQVAIRQASAADFSEANVERFHRYKQEGILRPPEDPAKLILWMLSEEAAELNGEVLAIDDPETAAKIGTRPRGR